MIYCSGNTFQTRTVSFPSLHSRTESSWVLPLYKQPVTLCCSWKLHVVCSEPWNIGDPLKTLLWKSSSKPPIYLSVLTQNNNRPCIYLWRVGWVYAVSSSISHSAALPGPVGSLSLSHPQKHDAQKPHSGHRPIPVHQEIWESVP